MDDIPEEVAELLDSSPGKVIWLGTNPTHCDLCGTKLNFVFYDAATRSGRWGCLCADCFSVQGCQLGTGRGQKYERWPECTEWVKTEG